MARRRAARPLAAGWNRLLRGRVARLAVVVLAAAGLTVPAASPAAALTPSLPSGFTLSTITTGLPQWDLVNFVFLPNGDLLVAGRCGTLRRVSEAGTSSPVTGFPGAYCTGDRGLLGIDVAPDFATSRALYTLYDYTDTATGKIMARLSRWTADSATAPTAISGETVILDQIPSFSSTGATCDDSHTIGTVVAAKDGSLYVGNGDASSWCSVDTSALGAQDLTSPRGKILRLTPDGKGLPSNPFYDAAAPSSWRSRVFAYGVRNPYRFTLQPATQAVYLGDVGWTSFEEVDVARGGENFGWPCHEGPLTFRNGYDSLAQCQALYTAGGVTAPLVSSSHNNGTSAFVGGAFYTGSSYPLAYQNAFFYADYALGTVSTLRTDANHALVPGQGPTTFGTGMGSPVTIRTGPSGDVYFADLETSSVQRLRYSPGNRAPVARIVPSNTGGPAPLQTLLDGSTSYDLDGEPLTSAWTFSDGTTATGAQVTKTWTANGTYTATLTVADTFGATGTASVTITVGNNAPTLTVTGFTAGQTVAVGNTVTLRGTATDVEDGAIPDGSITYTSRLLHCPYGGPCHVHPGPLAGETRIAGGWTVTVPDHGDESYVQVTVAAKDSRGATSQRTIDLTPRYRTLQVSSTPLGVPVVLNATDSNTAPVYRAVEGSLVTLSAPQEFNDKVFQRWSDGGTRSRSLTMPARDVALTAVYDTRPRPIASVSATTGAAPLTVQFSSAGTVDPDGDPVTLSWNFGDGSAAVTTANPTKTYTAVGTYTATLTATDSLGVTGTATVTVKVTKLPAGLIASYTMDEGVGTGILDESGNGNSGAMNGVWTQSGKSGAAMTLSGLWDAAWIPDRPVQHVSGGLTAAGWARPTTVTGSRALVVKEGTAAGPYSGTAWALYASDATGRPAASVTTASGTATARGTAALPVNAWSHLAMTYDGATLKLFVGGTQVGSAALTGAVTASTGALRIGGDDIDGAWYAGTVDEVQLYDRALTPAELAIARGDGAVADLTPPTAPATLAATGGPRQVSLTWAASTDAVGVVGYDVHRSTTTPVPVTTATRVASVTTTSFVDGPIAAGTYSYVVVARDAAGNVSASSPTATATAQPDTTPPTGTVTSPAAGSTVRGTVDLTATVSDNVGVAGVRFTVDGVAVGAEDTAAPYTVSWDTTTATLGGHSVVAVVRDTSGTSRSSAAVSVTVAPTAAGGLVAAYNADEGSGGGLTDRSGNGNHGAVNSGWSTAGKYGGALSLTGQYDAEWIPATVSQRLTTGMTLSAWVNPSSVTGTRAVLVKEGTAAGAYTGSAWGLYASGGAGGTGRPAAAVTPATGARTLTGATTAIPTGSWTHLAATYDGTTLRLYVADQLVSSTAVSGALSVSPGALRIGGNDVFGEWYAGLIDEVHVYNRALSATEVAADGTFRF